MDLLDNGAQVNTITLRYVNDHSLQVGPITDLIGSKVTYVGLGNMYIKPLGYMVIWVQVDGVKGYDEDEVALVILDFSSFAARILVILGTPTINRVVNVMKETEVDTLATTWANARVAHLLSMHRAMPMEVGDNLKEKSNPNDYDQLMYTQKAETIDPFSSHVVWVKAKQEYKGECINIMMQALWTEDGSLPQGLVTQNTYTELRKGSKKAVVVVCNNTAYLQTLRKKIPVARMVAVSTPLEGDCLLGEASESQDPQNPQLTVR